MPGKGNKHSNTGVEMYASARYFTMTGNQLPGSPDDIRDGAEALACIHSTFIAKTKKEKKQKKPKRAAFQMSDEELMGKTTLLRGRVCIGKTPDGRNLNKYVTAETEEELEAKKEAIRQEYITGTPTAKNVPFWEYAEEWYRVKKEPHISPASRRSYRVMLTKHILPKFGVKYLRAISAKQLQEFMNTFEGSSKSQITQAKTILEGVFQQAFAEGILDRNPACSLVRPKASKKEKRRALTQTEVAGVMEAIRKNENGLFLAVLYYLGVRRGEALGLQWGDIDFDEAQVHIQRDIDYQAASFAMEGD